MIDQNNYAPTITTTPLPWHCYTPDTLGRKSFYQSNLGWVQLTEIPGATRRGEYVLASILGRYIDTRWWKKDIDGVPYYDWHSPKNKIELHDLLVKMGCPEIDKAARAIYCKDGNHPVCQRFLRTRFEYAYIRGLWAQDYDGKIYLAKGLRRYERLLGAAVEHSCVHHILPQAIFPESAIEIRNLILLPTTIHKELHDIVYKPIEKKGTSPNDAVREWIRWTTADDKERWVDKVYNCARIYSEALQARAPRWEFIK